MFPVHFHPAETAQNQQCTKAQRIFINDLCIWFINSRSVSLGLVWSKQLDYTFICVAKISSIYLVSNRHFCTRGNFQNFHVLYWNFFKSWLSRKSKWNCFKNRISDRNTEIPKTLKGLTTHVSFRICPVLLYYNT